MKSFSLSLFFLFLSILSQAQIDFEKKYTPAIGTTDAPSMCRTPDGGYVIVGTSFYPTNPVIIKTDSLGNVMWEKKYFAGQALDVFSDIISTHDHALVICGFTYNFDNTTSKGLIIKTDSAGNVLWSKYIGAISSQLSSWSVKETIDNDFIIYGNSPGNGPASTFLVRISSSGNLLWSYSYGNMNSAWAGEVISCKDKGFLYTQAMRDSNSENYIYALKVDSAGLIQWGRKIRTNITGTNSDYGMALRETNTKGYVLSGIANDGDLLLIKLDIYGNISWAKKHDFGFWIDAISIDNTKDQGLIIAIDSKFGTSGFLLKTDSLGNVDWAKEYGPTDVKFKKVVALPNGRGYAATGTVGFSSNLNIYFVQTDSLGRTGCEQNVPFGSTTIPVVLDPYAAIFPGPPDSTITMQISGSFSIATEVSCVTGINSIVTENNFNVFPNPSSGIFTISTSETISSLQIFDLLGNNILQKTIRTNEERIDLSSQPKGIYFVKVMNENGKFEIQKIILE